MKTVYKAIITGKEIYKEIDLDFENRSVKFGTIAGCEHRLHRDLVFEDFVLSFSEHDESWFMECSGNIYIYTGDIRKINRIQLVNGNEFEIRYQNSNGTLFNVEFVINFDYMHKPLSRRIDIGNLSKICINGQTADIIIDSKYVRNDSVEMLRKDRGYIFSKIHSSFGVFINGEKAQAGGLINSKDYFSVGDVLFYYDPPYLWTELRSDIRAAGLSYKDEVYNENYPRFIRNVRVTQEINTEPIEILDPPEKPNKNKTNLFISLLPSMGMIATSAVMASMGSSMLVFSLMSGGLAIVTSVATLISNNIDYKKEVRNRIEKYNHYIEEKRKEIETERKKEVLKLEGIYFDCKKEQYLLSEFSSDLFDRHEGDSDFLHVRLGTGTIVSCRQVNYKKQEKLEIEDELQIMPEHLKNEYRLIESAPVVCDLKKAGTVAVIGDEESRYAMLKNMVFDLCTRHFPAEAELYFMAAEANAEKVTWCRFLPHVQPDNNGIRNIVWNDTSRNRLLDNLFRELSERKKDEKYRHIIVFLYDDCGIKTHPVSKFIEKAADYSVTFIFFSEDKSKAPIGCSQLIYLNSTKAGFIIDTKGNNESVNFSYTSVSDEMARGMVDILAPVYTEEISLESTLVKNISLFQLLQVYSVNDLDLKNRWNSTAVNKSMAAPIGVTKSGVIYLDLHDKAHGPHGLVAGTTGSGKSELLQTYILSAATLFHPYEVAFVIIDFKGGGMVNQFKDLPHLIGAITNIDGKEIDRSLKSIKAELQKRQRLFAEAEVNHIDKYILKYKAGEVLTPLPHLILIVDEFAELKAEQPEFMSELISAARIGRSLGVHLILATQKPSGQVDDQIWSNSRFKLCLKVQDASDSNEVLKSPLAAEIKEPGRAYIQVGNNEIFELFQSAYSGAPERAEDISTKEFDIYEVDPSGGRKKLYSQKRKKSDEIIATQLDAIVSYINKYCLDNNIVDLPDICLPSLNRVIDFPERTEVKNNMIDIGVYDDPDNQVQASTWLDIDNKNTFIIGSSQYGKTNLIQSFIKSIALHKKPQEGVIYILDFGSMVLKNFEKLHHVGGVVTSSEDEKLKNLFKLLFEEIAVRRERMIEAGVSSHAAYLEAGYKDIPHIYLIVDNISALMELYLEDDDSLLQIIRDGLAVGISVIMTNSQTAGISYRYLSNFANKLAFYCNDSSEYMNIIDHCLLEPDEIAGRCVLEIDKRILECQTYLAFSGEREFERVQAIQKFISEINSAIPSMHARRIPAIPDVLTTEIIREDFAAAPKAYSIPIGITYNGVEPYYLDLSMAGIFGVCGKEGTGHTNFINYILESLSVDAVNNPADIVFIDDIKRKYAYLKDETIVDRYIINFDDVKNLLAEWHSRLEKRYEYLEENGELGEDQELLLMLVQNNDVAKKISDDYELMDQFNDLLDRFAGLNAVIIFTNYPNASISYDSPEPLRRIKNMQHLIYTEELDNLKPFDVPYEAMRANKKKLGKGDAYYIKDNEVIKLKMVKADAE